MPHGLRKVWEWRLNDQMVVIGHQAVIKTSNLKAFNGLREDADEMKPVINRLENGLPIIPATGDVIKGVYVLNA